MKSVKIVMAAVLTLSLLIGTAAAVPANGRTTPVSGGIAPVFGGEGGITPLDGAAAPPLSAGAADIAEKSEVIYTKLSGGGGLVGVQQLNHGFNGLELDQVSVFHSISLLLFLP